MRLRTGSGWIATPDGDPSTGMLRTELPSAAMTEIELPVLFATTAVLESVRKSTPAGFAPTPTLAVSVKLPTPINDAEALPSLLTAAVSPLGDTATPRGLAPTGTVPSGIKSISR